MTLLRLPTEIIFMIVGGLDLEDQFHLSMSCQDFHRIIRENGICKTNLEKYAPFTLEYKEAQKTGQYARAWRQVTKRKIAVQTGSPFLLSIVGVADSFIYKNGALVYSIGQEYIRILLLEGSVTEELALDPRQLIQASMPQSQSRNTFTLSPLYYAQGIATFLAQSSNTTERPQLVVWDTQKSEGFSHIIHAKRGLFIRNDDRYLYYGIQSSTANLDPEFWVIRGIDLNTREKVPDPVNLPPLFGGDVGSNACFEIIDGFFYGISSEQVFESEPVNWNSFYQIFRFQLGRHETRKFLPKSQSWRRHAKEGSIDNRWSSLSLVQDESTDGIFIYETRKEWSPQKACSQRNCYRKEIKFSTYNEGKIEEIAEALDESLYSEAYSEVRLPNDVHNGDSGSHRSTCTYMDSCIRSYNTLARTFVDVVNDPVPGSEDTLRLRLRVRPMSKDCRGQPGDLPEQLTTAEVFKGDLAVRVWPPEARSEQADPAINRAFSLLTPKAPGQIRNWSADGRNIVYSVSGPDTDHPPTLVLISFDPGLRLVDLPKNTTPLERTTDSLSPTDLPKVLNPLGGHPSEKVQPFYSFMMGQNGPLPGLDMTY